MQRSRPKPENHGLRHMTFEHRIHVAFASDEVTAIPVGVAIASLLETRAASSFLEIHVLSCGMTNGSKARIGQVVSDLARGGCRLTWHEISGARAKRLEDFYVRSDRPYPPASYARLLLGDLVSPEVGRVIYMDSDIVAQTDLAPLWMLMGQDEDILAVQDLPHDSDQIGRLLRTISDEDRKEYGLTVDHVYFQSGILVLNLAPFRAGIVEDVAKVLKKYPGLSFPDQDALNIVFARRHRLIDPRWNQMSAVYWYKPETERPYDPDLFEKLRDDPWIIHYSGRPKPWEKGCDHPLADRWHGFFARTPWATRRNTLWDRIYNKGLRVHRVLSKKLGRYLRKHI